MATLTGAPSVSSSADILNVTVGGVGVSSYIFKVGIDTGPDYCASLTDYGSVTEIATPITASLSAIPAGSWAKLCVLGVDAAGNLQQTATSAAWQKTCVPGQNPSLGSCSVSCPAGQVIVGAAVKSGAYMDKIGVRCQTFTNGALTGAITDGPAYSGTGGSPTTFDCSSGSTPGDYYLYRITGSNTSTYLDNITFYCRSLTNNPTTETFSKYGGIAKKTFDYSCPDTKPITSISYDSVSPYAGRILQAYCGSDL